MQANLLHLCTDYNVLECNVSIHTVESSLYACTCTFELYPHEVYMYVCIPSLLQRGCLSGCLCVE